MILIKEYIALSLAERQNHLDLTQPCLERGGFSTKFCGVLAEGLGTTIPERKIDGVNVHLCHACNNDRCSNLKHLYWGTPKENFNDTVLHRGKPNPWLASVNKHGLERATEIARQQTIKNNKAGLSGFKRRA